MLKIRAVETAGLTVCKDVVFLLVPLIYNKNSDLRYEAAIALERIGWTPGSMKEKIYFYSAKKAWGEVAKLGEPAIEMLSIMLANDDDSIRIIAVEAFGELKTRKAANKIIECLKDKNKDIRVKAAEALGKIATIDVVEPLNRTLSSSDKELVLTSIEAVGKIKDVRSVNPLILLLANDDEAITDAATKSLVSIGIQGVGILKIKLTDPNPKIRLGVAEVLNQLGQKNLVAKYEKDNIAITKDSEVPVQPVMPVVAAPLTPDTAVKPAVPVVSDVPDSMPSSIRPVTPIVVPPIIPMPSSITPSAAPVTTASTPVTPVTPAVVAPVVPPIVSKEPVVPFQETVLSKDEYKNLIKDLLGNDKVKRISAAKKLGDIKERRALDPLIEVLDKSMSDKNFVSVLIDALTNIGDPKAVKGVSNFIGDSDLTVRSKAIGFLVGMGNFSINAISTKLKSNDVNVRTGAMDVLEKIGDKDSVLLLITALDDPDIKIAVRAVKMIGKLKEARAINTMILKLYTNNDELRTELENVLVGFGQVIVPLIKPMLEDSNPAVQRSAMRIYELLNTKNVKKMQFEEPGSYTSLIRDLKDPEITVRLAAVNELKILKIEKAVDPLQSAFESADSTDELQIAILDALMAINTQKAIEAICQALASEYSNVSAKAEIMILQIGEPAIMPLYKTSKTVSPSVRIKIVSVLSKMNMAKIIDYLSTFVKDKDSEVVMKTINVLSKTKDIKAVNAIILVLYSSDKELRSASQDALISMGEIVVDPLIEKLNDKNPNMFYGAARVLEAINIKRGLDAIREAEGRKEIDMFLVDLKSKDEQARSKAAEAIGNHKGKRAVDSLLSVINDPSEEVQIKAIEALGKIGDERSVDAIITKLFSENKDITDVSEKALIQIGEPSVKHLVDNIKNEKISDSIKHILEMMNTP